MANPGYTAVALDTPVAKKLRGVAHYLSLTAPKRVSMSEALDQLVSLWIHTVGLDPAVAAAITGQPVPVPSDVTPQRPARRKTQRQPAAPPGA